MKKIILSILSIFAFTTVASAASVGTFPISVNIPPATSVSFIVNKVTGPSNAPDFNANPDGNTLKFDVSFNDTNSIYLAGESFAIDLAPNGVANYQSITFSYTGETVPAGQTNGGLGNHAAITPVKVVGITETQLAGFGVRLGGTLPSITNADVAGGFLRVYVGLVTGERTGPLPTDPLKVPGSVPFSGADKTGDYGGTLKITATLV